MIKQIIKPPRFRIQNLNNTIKMTNSQVRFFKINSIVVICLVLCASQVLCEYGERMQYHEQGVNGPYSYKFGYSTGDHYNPQERHEVSDGYGHVKGWYSYRDPYGKIQVIHYEAHPKLGFRVFQNKEARQSNKHY
ncbi:hypothetical protein GZH46_01178 [Fragariocoptes setiger]|uniref:Uncharacterized protein n=1 Tax=Fragariocoptes setiger TaxID=1670756 RepID=A0ABQ7SAK9_9ACAR|nr:hypothetical protein GZH46_01178 [Fragariocoptes setiger]